MIEPNNGRVFPGAKSVLIPPITPGDCTIFPSLEQLATEENKAGRGCTIRQGRGWATRTTLEIASTCTPLQPTISDVALLPLVIGVPFTLDGAHFYTTPGQVWLGNKPTWAASTIKVLQPGGTWSSTSIVTGGATRGILPDTCYAYVLNAYGLRNAVGFTVWW